SPSSSASFVCGNVRQNFTTARAKRRVRSWRSRGGMPRVVQGGCRSESRTIRNASSQLVALPTYFSTFPLFHFVIRVPQSRFQDLIPRELRQLKRGNGHVYERSRGYKSDDFA